ncbi:sulfurtransferase TusA family protein [Pleionea litopenaei]|uniref:Sulfurtransferase TusA family protein n=1 Tax=Pleionea litopenaei TaxID=3070815 RepID=A0AA51RTY2_9GAMM|nr:sulfurtransferase TusA family protein [Pleionea sp. HL-JVS1]WMS87439.1 sulfurtransferase TusA family protein [Pleionea sp. HL-JVS1]
MLSDCRELTCPWLLVKVKQQLSKLPAGSKLEVWASDPSFLSDIQKLAQKGSIEVINNVAKEQFYIVEIQNRCDYPFTSN